MIPYFEWRTVALGPVVLQVWGAFAALGVILGTWYAVREARKRGLDPRAFETAAFWTIVAAFVGARVFHVIAYEPATFIAAPSEIFKVWHGGLSVFGGFLGAALSFLWHISKAGKSAGLSAGLSAVALAKADALTRALPLALGCGRLGCFLIHDHPGTLAHGAGKWLAVNYPDGPRYDLGLLLGLLDFAMFGLFIWLAKNKKRPDGFFLALFMLIYGPARFLLDFLRVNDVRYLGATPAQYGTIILFVGGIWLMTRLYRQKNAPS